MLSLKALEEDLSPLLPIFWWLLAILGIPWLVVALFQSLHPYSHGVSLSVYLWLNFTRFTRTSGIGLGPTLVQYDLILAWVYLQGIYFQMRSYSHSYRQLGVQHIFWGGHNLTHTLPVPSLIKVATMASHTFFLHTLSIWIYLTLLTMLPCLTGHDLSSEPFNLFWSFAWYPLSWDTSSPPSSPFRSLVTSSARVSLTILFKFLH